MNESPAPTVHLERGTRAGFISDLHLSPGRPDIESRFERYLDAASGRIDALFILGDLFEFWIGDDAAERCGHARAESLLRAFLKDTGCRGFIMHGNRDFLIGNAWCERVGCERLADPSRLEIAGTPILLSHGDALCTDDLDHQRFRAMVHDPAWQRAFLAREIDDRLAFATEARSRSESGKSAKSPEIMDVNDAAVERAMASQGVRYLIHGHTHRPAIHHHVVDGDTATRVVLGDWFDGENTLTVTDDAIRYTLAGNTLVVPLGTAPRG